MALDLFTKRLPSAILKALAALANGAGVLTNNGSGTLSWAAAAATVDSYDAVGSYLFAHSTTDTAPNSTISGSSLTPANVGANALNSGGGAFGLYTAGGTRSGTWRAMGNGANGYPNKCSLYIRTV